MVGAVGGASDIVVWCGGGGGDGVGRGDVKGARAKMEVEGVVVKMVRWLIVVVVAGRWLWKLSVSFGDAAHWGNSIRVFA